jgi:hypothetical protein
MKRKYGALRTVAVIITIIAWIILIVGVLGSLALGLLMILGTTYADGLAGDLLAGGVVTAVITIVAGIIVSVLYFVFLLAFAQLIYLLVDVERNTREAAYRLRTGKREEFEPID